MATRPSPPVTLESLRERIDALDDALHDLLMERAGIVEQVSRRKQSDSLPPFRPGREARILRRLVTRHRGHFPRPALVRIWREILSGSIAMQAELSVAYAGGSGDLARDHFGSQAPMIELGSAAEVILSVREGRADVGVLPLNDDEEPWWLALAEREAGRPRVILRLPFGQSSHEDQVEDAFVIARFEPEASGDDCTLYAIEASAPLPAARITDALLEAGLDGAPVTQRERGAGAAMLAEIGGLMGADDGRMMRALAPLGAGFRATWLGAYARPLPDAALDGIAPE